MSYSPYIRYGQYRMRNRYYSRMRMNIYAQYFVPIPCSRRTWDWDEILRIHTTNFLGYTRARRASAAQLRINIHTRSRVISIAHPARFLSNGGCCRYQTWICGYVQRALGTARVWNVVVKEQRVHGGRLKFTLMCTFLVKAESGG